MAKVDWAKDISMQINSSGVTRVRQKVIWGKSIEEMYQANLFPPYRSSHPENPAFRLTDSNISTIGNEGREIQALWEGTYQTGTSTFPTTSTTKDPWDYGAMNFSSGTFTEQEALHGVTVYNETLKEKEYVWRVCNSAGSPIEATSDRYYREYSFVYYRKSKRTPLVNVTPLLNERKVTIAGEEFERGTVLLMPMTPTKIIDFDDNGRSEREYWEISVTLRVKKISGANYGWLRPLLNVGTLAIPPGKKRGEVAPAPIYRYIPWKSRDSEDQLRTTPQYGSIAEVIAAKRRYAELGANDEEKRQLFNDLPYEEMTEPMPLDEDGHVDILALNHNTQYNKIIVGEYSFSDFSHFDLPKNKE